MKKFYTMLAALSIGAATAAFAENPAELYLCGNMNSWTTPNIASPDQLIVLSETSDGIYEGNFSYDQIGSMSFKVFSEKTDWSNLKAYFGTNVYLEVIDGKNPVTWNIGLSDDGYYNDIQVANWPGGEGTVTVNWADKTLTLLSENEAKGLAEEMYVVGTMNNWVAADANYQMAADPNQKGYFSGSFYIPAGNIEFKFTADSNWTDNYGAYASESPITLFKGQQRYLGTEKNGSNFVISDWAGGEITFSLDILSNSMTIVSMDAPGGPEEIHLVGAMNNWDFTNLDYKLTESPYNPGHYQGKFEIAKDAFDFNFAAGTDGEVVFGGGSNFANGFDIFRFMNIAGPLVTDGCNLKCTNWEGGVLSIDIDYYNKSFWMWCDDAPDSPELYLSTNTNGWSNSDPTFKLTKSEWDPSSYSATLQIPESGRLEFKIVAEDDDSFSYGIIKDLADGFDLWKYDYLNFTAEKNGDSFVINNWEGGTLDIYFSLAQGFVSISSDTQPERPEEPKDDVLYLIGSPQGWNIDYSDIILTRESQDMNIYTGTLDFASEQSDVYFRFYRELGDWENGSIGSQYVDDAVEISIDPEYTGECVYGKGSWYVPTLKAGITYLTVDLDNMTVKFSDDTVGVNTIASEGNLIYNNGIVKASSKTAFMVVDATGKVVMMVNGNEADLNNLSRGIYFVKAGAKTLKVIR